MTNVPFPAHKRKLSQTAKKIWGGKSKEDMVVALSGTHVNGGITTGEQLLETREQAFNRLDLFSQTIAYLILAEDLEDAEVTLASFSNALDAARLVLNEIND